MAKATITYKGQGDQESITFRNTEFKKGEAVEVSDPMTVAKLENNPNFDVQIAPPDKPPPEGETPPEVKFVPAPSEMPAQYPVPKPGEPVGGPTGLKPQQLKPIPKAPK